MTVSPEEAYREHRVALLRLAYLVGASRELAEDVVQAAFATAQPRWDQVEDALPYLKGSDLRAYTVGDLRRVEERIITRPRKTLIRHGTRPRERGQLSAAVDTATLRRPEQSLHMV